MFAAVVAMAAYLDLTSTSLTALLTAVPIDLFGRAALFPFISVYW